MTTLSIQVRLAISLTVLFGMTSFLFFGHPVQAQMVEGEIAITVEKRVPQGDLGAGPFNISVDCGNLGSHDFTLGGGESSTFNLPSFGETGFTCTISEILTAAQAQLFNTPKIGDEKNPTTDDGTISAKSFASQGKYYSYSAFDGAVMYVENTPKTTSTPASVAVVEDDDDDGDDLHKPRGLRVACHNDGTALLKWRDKSDGEDGNYIERRVGNGPWVLVKHSETPNRDNWTDTNLPFGQTYTWRIRSYDGDKVSNWSAEISCACPAGRLH